MLKSKRNKKIALLVLTCIFALCIAIGAVIGVNLSASAATTGRVTMLDLMGRYPIDYVLGPIDVV